MSGQLAEQIARVNKRMIELLEEAHKDLRGEGNFGVEEIRKLREPLNEMDPVMRQAGELQRTSPDISPELELYKSHLAELSTILDQLASCCWRNKPICSPGERNSTPQPTGLRLSRRPASDCAFPLAKITA